MVWASFLYVLEHRSGSIRRAVLKTLFGDARLAFVLRARIAFAVELSTYLAAGWAFCVRSKRPAHFFDAQAFPSGLKL